MKLHTFFLFFFLSDTVSPEETKYNQIDVIPGILKIGASSKNSENFSASSVALDMSNFKSVLKRVMSFISPNRMSVCRVLS